MEFNNIDIENYKEQIVKDFMLKSVEEIKKEFSTDRICWAFVVWTYRTLNIFTEDEDRFRLKNLLKKFNKVEEKDLPYRFPDIVVFKNGYALFLGRHAGIMLDRKRFVHLGKDCNGLQFTDLTILPWSHSDKVVIRHDEVRCD
jgi:hypothetical protein